jgi:3-deoxy-7-phosphoheptulonate synthase
VIIVMKPEATEGDIEGVLDALTDRGLSASVSRGQECTVVGVIGDVDAAGDLGPLSILSGVERTMRVSHPYKLVAAREGARSLVRVGSSYVGPPAFALIAGPCAIETREQAAEACAAAAAAGATLLRGDLYKHRTSPYAFQGLGPAGLEILAEQKQRFGLPVVVEVLHPQELDDALVEVVDVFRVGARNMQNFDLLRACSLTGKPLMLKRGLSATIEEWLLAAEYAASSGNLNIILCERGIRTFEPATRNTLDLSAVSVVQQRSHLPVIVDPSHGTGHRSLVAPMALAAVAAGADGIMMDVHPRPETALCDGPQALVPQELLALASRVRELATWMGRQVHEPAAVSV